MNGDMCGGHSIGRTKSGDSNDGVCGPYSLIEVWIAGPPSEIVFARIWFVCGAGQAGNEKHGTTHEGSTMGTWFTVGTQTLV